jgi:PAS domain S-box-containing protein
LGVLPNLRVSTKVALVGAVAVGVGLLLSGLRVKQDLEVLQLARQELRGTEYLEALSVVFQRVAEHRGLSARLLSGADVRAEVADKQRQVEEALGRLGELEGRHGRSSETAEALERIRGRWEQIRGSLASMTPRESFDRHTELLGEILELMWRVAVASGIPLDPYPDGLYLANAVVGPLPRALEAMGQLRALGSAVLTRKSASLAERMALQERRGAVRLFQQVVEQQLAEAFAANPSARAALEGKLREGDRLAETYLRVAGEQVAWAERFEISPEEYFALATRAIDARFDLYREAVRQLQEAIQARVRRTQARVAGTVAGSLALVVLVGVLAGVTARSVTGPLGQLVRALERVRQGDLRVRLDLGGQDELAQVARAFDATVAQLRETLDQVRTLHALAAALNVEQTQQGVLRAACPLLQRLLGVQAVWAYLVEGQTFTLSAACGLPPGLEEDDRRELRWQPCRCQELLLRGELRDPVNVVECLRLEKLRLAGAGALTGGLRAHATVPVRVGGRVAAILNFARPDLSAVDESTLRVAGIVAETLGVALERARLQEQAEQLRSRERQAATRLSQTLLGTLDLRVVAEETLGVLREFLKPDGGALLVRDPSGKWVELVSGWGSSAGFRWLRLEPPTDNPVAWAAAQGTPVVLDLDSPPVQVPPGLRSAGVRTLLVLPLSTGGQVTGAVVLDYRAPRPLSEEQLQFAAGIAGLAAVAVERSLEHLGNRLLFEGMPVGLYRSTPAGRFLDVNSALVRMLGYPDRETLLATPVTALYVDPDDRARWQELMEREGQVVGFETYWRRADGSVVAVRESARLLRDAGRPARVLRGQCGGRDGPQAAGGQPVPAGQLRRADGPAEPSAVPGGGPTGRGTGPQHGRARGGPGAGFGPLPGRQRPPGAFRGDGVLRAAAEALRHLLPPETPAARFGGDSFGVCLPVLDVQQARQVAEDVLAGLRSRVTPEGGRRIPVTGSCGVAVFPDHAREPEELVVLAEVAMYAAKEQGRDRVSLATADPGWRDRYRTPVERLGLLRQAVAEGRVLVYVQPVLDLRTGRVSGYELLARLGSPEGGVLEPSAFLELAERHGLAQEVDLRVCHTALELVGSTTDLRFHVNLSAGALLDRQALARLLRAGEELGPAASRVVLEVTERMALADLEKVLPAVDALRARGFQLALDDFGTGVSSLYLLRRLPVDYVKVDRSFVRNLAVDVHDQAIIRSVVELCRGVGRFVVAEGVETEEVLERLRGLGVDYAQGYHIARPGPLEEVLGRW